jgi:hypothetical protein
MPFGGRHRLEWLFGVKREVLPQRGVAFATPTVALTKAAAGHKLSRDSSTARTRTDAFVLGAPYF